MKKGLGIILFLLSLQGIGQGVVLGRVTDKVSHNPMGYVTVAIYKQGDASLVTGGTTDYEGRFTIKKVPFGNYYLVTSFIGYRKDTLSFVIDKKHSRIEFPEIVLSPDEALLEEVDVVVEKPTVVYEIDKKVVNVESMNTAVAATAIEVLENIPSITTDMDGNISLRGSTGFTLLIDGRPTALPPTEALQLIPANNIKDVEIITNPSAKYDAEGTSGIINIILKRNKLEGMGVLINLNGGNFDNYGTDFIVSLNKNKFKVNIGANYKNVNRYRNIEQRREIEFQENQSLVTSNGLHRFFRTNYGLNTAIEWKSNQNNVFSFGGNINQRQYNAAANYDFNEYLNDSLVSVYSNKEQTLRTFIGGTASADFRHFFNGEKKHYVNLSAMYNSYYGNEHAQTENFNLNDAVEGGNITTEVGPSNLLRFNLDYEKPLKKEMKLKLGARTDFGFNKDDQASYKLNLLTGEYEKLPLFSTEVDYKQNVYAAYSILSGKYKTKVQYQAGLRAEYTDRYIYSHTLDSKATIERLDWFPSLHLTYASNDKTQFKASFSRRIRRPRSWHLEPFIAWEDPYTVRQGNPNLLPQYIGSYELGYLKELKKSTLSAELYYRTTINHVERIQEAYDTNVIIKRPVNAGSSQALGVELSYNLKVKKWWTFDFGGNAFGFHIAGVLNNIPFERQTFTYNLRIANNFWVKKDWKLQVVTKYVAPQVTAQGSRESFYSFDLAVKKDFWKNKMSASFQFENFANTMRRENTVDVQGFYSNRVATPLYPFLSFALTMRLNNYSNKDRIRTVKGDEF